MNKIEAAHSKDRENSRIYSEHERRIQEKKKKKEEEVKNNAIKEVYSTIEIPPVILRLKEITLPAADRANDQKSSSKKSQSITGSTNALQKPEAHHGSKSGANSYGLGGNTTDPVAMNATALQAGRLNKTKGNAKNVNTAEQSHSSSSADVGADTGQDTDIDTAMSANAMDSGQDSESSGDRASQDPSKSSEDDPISEVGNTIAIPGLDATPVETQMSVGPDGFDQHADVKQNRISEMGQEGTGAFPPTSNPIPLHDQMQADSGAEKQNVVKR